MYTCVYIYIYIYLSIYLSIYVYIYIYIYISYYAQLEGEDAAGGARRGARQRVRLLIDSVTYTRSPLEDSHLFGPSPWKTLAATNEKNISEQPSPWRKSSKRESCYGDQV